MERDEIELGCAVISAQDAEHTLESRELRARKCTPCGTFSSPLRASVPPVRSLASVGQVRSRRLHTPCGLLWVERQSRSSKLGSALVARLETLLRDPEAPAGDGARGGAVTVMRTADCGSLVTVVCERISRQPPFVPVQLAARQPKRLSRSCSSSGQARHLKQPLRMQGLRWCCGATTRTKWFASAVGVRRGPLKRTPYAPRCGRLRPWAPWFGTTIVKTSCARWRTAVGQRISASMRYTLSLGKCRCVGPVLRDLRFRAVQDYMHMDTVRVRLRCTLSEHSDLSSATHDASAYACRCPFVLCKSLTKKCTPAL